MELAVEIVPILNDDMHATRMDWLHIWPIHPDRQEAFNKLSKTWHNLNLEDYLDGNALFHEHDTNSVNSSDSSDNESVDYDIDS